MFGYVTPCKSELKIKEYEVFTAYYCGLCKSIKSNFGNMPRLALNYDMTFLAVLHDSLSDGCLKPTQSFCILHPKKKKKVIVNTEALNYASFCNVALTYYKLVDDVVDDKSLKSKALSLALKPYFKKFPDNYRPMLDIISQRLKELSSIEAKETFSLDEIADPFSVLTGEILSFNQDSSIKEDLYWLGYNLGKWIYTIDAIDDLKEDMDKNKFNPITKIYNKDNLSYIELYGSIKDRLDFILFSCGQQTLECFNRLPIKKNKNLLLNVLEFGLQEKIYKVLKGVTENA
ncbi:DUF5685 family protein [Clostridium cellulovorans]|uniref:Uncharacterized protein n=1 Tax=Clostridium cellulovorans (strain ATCC 35296 / DSM 3052 / OCM 3 / 743B) TaxID=573061 RepID=D9SUB7_CLOC7|nr:DUF5685 family protein [Clostridium cellulovorans]ADL52872.1 hypothetical protein Clocel_3186 [Clostridium cellulovorans 743B]